MVRGGLRLRRRIARAPASPDTQAFVFVRMASTKLRAVSVAIQAKSPAFPSGASCRRAKGDAFIDDSLIV